MDDGGKIIQPQQSTYWVAVDPDNRNWLQKKRSFWIIPNPFYQIHRNDIQWFGIDYSECSGNPKDCPENDGYGCCKNNHEGKDSE